MKERIDHIAIQVENPGEAAEWYSKNFGAELLYVDDTWGFVQFMISVLFGKLFFIYFFLVFGFKYKIM